MSSSLEVIRSNAQEFATYAWPERVEIPMTRTLRDELATQKEYR